MPVNVELDSSKFQKEWSCPENENSDFVERGGVFSTPFKHLILPDFVKDTELLSSLRKELLGLEFHEKNNDLYKFRQSSDLKSIDTGAIKAFKELLYTDFREWLVTVTGLALETTVDISCAQYTSTDVLLCHDDELEGRRIAFIFYLVEESWGEEDGGTLDLFSSDANGEPDKIVKRIVPKWNNLALFEVTPVSHHQVAEVLSDKVRLSISGWFYGQSLPRPSMRPETPRLLEKPVILEQEDYFDWINPSYMNPESQGDIQEHFEHHSEIQLQDFLNQDIHKSLFDSLYSPELAWKDVGPPHKRFYGISEKSSEIMERARDFFSSELMLLLLSNMTGLKLHPLAPDSESEGESEEEVEKSEAAGSSKRTAQERKSGKKKARLEAEAESEVVPEPFVEWRRFQHGNYTLLHDAESSKSEHSLMLVYYLSKDEWDQEWGGYTSFIAKGENEELLTVAPKDNCLALVYCCPATLSFLKHVNNRSGNNKFFSLYGFYTEVGGRSNIEEEQSESESSESSQE